jgi:hypothetical protein
VVAKYASKTENLLLRQLQFAEPFHIPEFEMPVPDHIVMKEFERVNMRIVDIHIIYPSDFRALRMYFKLKFLKFNSTLTFPDLYFPDSLIKSAISLIVFLFVHNLPLL